MSIGDVVQLKSGGPAMTVEGMSAGWTSCQWFVAGELKAAQFVPDVLKPVDQGKPVLAAAPRRRCACSDAHPLRQHGTDGLCQVRGPNGELCRGHCRIIEGGGT